MKVLHGLLDRGSGTDLRTVLDDPTVLLRRADELFPLPEVMRTGLLDINVFPGLAGPDADQGVPVIWCRNRDGVDRPVLEKLADVDVGLRFTVQFAAVLPQDVFVD